MLHNLLYTQPKIPPVPVAQFNRLKLAPDGTDSLAIVFLPVVEVSAVTSTSTVGLPLESNISLPCISTILIHNDIKKPPCVF